MNLSANMNSSELVLDLCFLMGFVAGHLLCSKRQVDVLVMVHITALH